MDGTICPLPTVRPRDDDVGERHNAGDNADGKRRRRRPDHHRSSDWTRLREQEIAGEEPNGEAPDCQHDHAKSRFHI